MSPSHMFFLSGSLRDQIYNTHPAFPWYNVKINKSFYDETVKWAVCPCCYGSTACSTLFFQIFHWVYWISIPRLGICSSTSQNSKLVHKHSKHPSILPMMYLLIHPFQRPRCKKWVKKSFVDHFDKMDCDATMSSYMASPYSATSQLLYHKPLPFFWYWLQTGIHTR